MNTNTQPCETCEGTGQQQWPVDYRGSGFVSCPTCNGRGSLDWNPYNIKPGYCFCGCGQKTRVYERNYHDRGLKKGEAAQYLKFHKGRTNFAIDKNDCWVWNGVPDADGYATTHWDNKSVKVYRAMYELLVGPVPEGKVIDHLCRVRMCVNPTHLEPVTNAVNIRRGHSTPLSIEQVDAIRKSIANNVALGKAYGVDHTTIRRIKKGLRWTAN